MPPFQSRSEARAHLRKLRLQCSSQSQSQSLRAEGALVFLETARSKSRSRAPPAASGAFATWQAAGGRAPPATSPERWGRSWASRPSRCAVAARALTPIHSDSAPQAPARASGAFSVKGGSRGWCGPQPRRGEDTALDATGATQACRQGVGGALPRHPCPSAKGPGRVAGRRLWACGAGGTPCPGVQGARSPWACTANKKPSAEGEHFLLFELRSSALHGPQKGPKSKRQKGTPESHR